MTNYNYFIVALLSEEKTDLKNNIDDFKEVLNGVNFKLKSRGIEENVLLTSMSNTTVQIIIRVKSDNKMTIESLEELSDIVKNQLKESNAQYVKSTKILYKLPISEVVANKIVLDLRDNNKSEFDLVSALLFNDVVGKIISNDLKKQMKAIEEGSESSNRFNTRFDRKQVRGYNSLEYINYNDKQINELIDEIQSDVLLSTALSEELNLLNNVCSRIKKPVNYIFELDHVDMYEDEIFKLILTVQTKCGTLKKPEYSVVNLFELLNPSRPMYSMGQCHEEEISLGLNDIGIVIKRCEYLENLSENEMYRFIKFINSEEMPFILLVDRSKICEQSKLDRNLGLLKKTTISRTITLKEGQKDRFYGLVKKEIELHGYELSSKIQSEDIISCYTETFGNQMRITLAKRLSEQIIFEHEIISGGKIINSLNKNEVIINEEKTSKKRSAIEELDNMVGLNILKDKVRELVALYKIKEIRKDFNLEIEETSRNIVLKGNPGTGKTTFSRLLAKILKEEGIIEKEDIVEVSRDDLIAKYVGWTAKTITEYFEKAKGGVLFIDEAYLLDSDFEDGYGEEAIGTIVRNMENFRDDVIVVMAGYPKEMDELIKANPGMESRIAVNLEIEDYSAEELLEIFDLICKQYNYIYNSQVSSIVYDNFKRMKNSGETTSGNGRYVRKIFERIQMAQALRLSKITNINTDDLSVIVREDVSFLLNSTEFEKHEPKQITIGFRTGQ